MLTEYGIPRVFHYAPLHYLAYIARASALCSKTRLKEAGFAAGHFRSTSQRQDISRGFANYVHLASNPTPPILAAKLRAGFPHFEIIIPSELVEKDEYHLCRFNIAKARYFKGAKQAPEESPKNGRYYPGKALPIAATITEKSALLQNNSSATMIEVLVPDVLHLSDSVTFRFFSAADYDIATDVLARLGIARKCEKNADVAGYTDRQKYRPLVQEFLELSLHDPSWHGNGIEFDRV